MIDQTFSGRLGLDQMACHIDHRVQVPPGARSLCVTFQHAPQHPGLGTVPHQISLSVYGPAGARGTRHNNADQSPVISETWASPGYTPGPIEPGSWLVQIDTHRILPPGGIDYQLRITTTDAPTAAPALAAPPGRTALRGPGWYRGDLHAHSHHSDARWGVGDMLAEARARGLDFATLTDHNTVSGLPEARALADDALLVMAGIELTTFHGHALALGASEWVDWRIAEGQTMADRAAEVMAAGHLFVIAHPMSEGHPWCTGCRWAYADVFPGPARMVEVWNSGWDEVKNELGLRLFQSWLDQGYRMRATAGSDSHGPHPAGARLGHVRVFASDLTQGAILAALRAGHASLTCGPVLELWADTAAGIVPMGGLVGAAPGPITLGLRWDEVPAGARLALVQGGPEGRATLIETQVSGAGSLGLPLLSPPARGWVMASLRCRDGAMLALGNPIFLPGDWR